MSTFFLMTRRNIKMYFKDKGMFFSSLIAPLILLLLYSTFLANVYRDSFTSSMPEGITVSDRLIGGTVGGELFTSLIAVSAVTVAFCCHMLMVQDKVTGTRRDLMITPTRKPVLAVSYYAATLISTLIVSVIATGVCFLYIAKVGWYMTVGDVFLVLLDVFLLSMFGTALSSFVNVFLSTQGQMNAVGTVVSAGYGFLCGAYMPISQFGSGLQKVISFLPGTYGTSLLRNHALRGVYREMADVGFPQEVIEGIRDSIDYNLYFFGHSVPQPVIYLIFVGSIALILGAYVLVSYLRRRRA